MTAPTPEHLRELAAMRLREINRLASEINLLSASNGHLRRELDGISKADAALGALVRRIREHEAGDGDAGVFAYKYPSRGGDALNWSLTEYGLTRCLSHLDSLLPKEPEVAPSGWSYQRVADGKIRQTDHFGGTLTFYGADHENVPPCDAPTVARLMEGAK